METYDDAAFERFCVGLVRAGFSPQPNTGQQIWTGPLRDSLKPLTESTRMTVFVYQGWPFRYAHIKIDGLRTEHAADGTLCLWAEDDPSQLAAQDLGVLWARIDEWADKARNGFRIEDRALDAYLLFERRSSWSAELPFTDLIKQGSNGYKTPLVAKKHGGTLLVRQPADGDADNPELLRGAFYLRNDIGSVPRTFADVGAALAKKQSNDLADGLRRRSDTVGGEVSGGYDFVVLGWPRHDKEHDAVALLFSGSGPTLDATAMYASSNDITARKRRAGPDADLLAGKTVLIAGAGSIGGHVAVALASSGVDCLRIRDADTLASANLARHVASAYAVGYKKHVGVSLAVEDHAPWTDVNAGAFLSNDPTELANDVAGVDLVVDCTGTFHVTAALAEVCRRTNTPLITGALFHQGALARIQRQTEGDTLIAARPTDPNYLNLPPEDPSDPQPGFLELGCTAPVNNAPPTSVLTAAADIAHASIDYLTGRLERADERIIVLRPMQALFEQPGTIDSPHRQTEDSE